MSQRGCLQILLDYDTGKFEHDIYLFCRQLHLRKDRPLIRAQTNLDRRKDEQRQLALLDRHQQWQSRRMMTSGPKKCTPWGGGSASGRPGCHSEKRTQRACRRQRGRAVGASRYQIRDGLGLIRSGILNKNTFSISARHAARMPYVPTSSLK